MTLVGGMGYLPYLESLVYYISMRLQEDTVMVFDSAELHYLLADVLLPVPSVATVVEVLQKAGYPICCGVSETTGTTYAIAMASPVLAISMDTEYQ